MDKFKCNNCQKPFKHRIAPSHKIVCKTVDYSNGQVSCRLCGEKLTSVTLKDHWRVHPKQIKSLKCRFCEKLFIQPVHRQAHETNTHHKIKEYACKMCPQQFAGASGLKKHMQTQHQEKTYKCQHCASSFMVESSLTAHEQYHDVTRPFACETCGLRYQKKFILQSHVNIVHAKDSFVCSKCSKEFKSRARLTRHDREIHQDVILRPCKECNFKTKRSESLRLHKKLVHNMD